MNVSDVLRTRLRVPMLAAINTSVLYGSYLKLSGALADLCPRLSTPCYLLHLGNGYRTVVPNWDIRINHYCVPTTIELLAFPDFASYLPLALSAVR